jgi:hypothetical protein
VKRRPLFTSMPLGSISARGDLAPVRTENSLKTSAVNNHQQRRLALVRHGLLGDCSTMKDSNGNKLDHGTFILFSIFDRAWSPALGKLENPVKLRRDHKMLVVGSCRILEWLGLVVPDRKLAFGCKPTERLESMFARRRAHPIKNSKRAWASIEEADVLNCIFDAVIPFKDQPVVCPPARALLHVLGLVRYTRDDEIPTRELRLLAAARRDKERNRLWLKTVKPGQLSPRGRKQEPLRLPTQV